MPGPAPRALAALLLAASVGLASPQNVRGDARDGGSPPPADGGVPAPDGGAVHDPDQEVIDHLDELEQLELLQHLGLLDASGEDEAPAKPPPRGSPR